MSLDLLASTAIACVAVGLAFATFLLARSPAAPPPTLGVRGWRRHEALGSSPALRTLEPILRVVAGWFRQLPLDRARVLAERRLFLAGDYLGLDADGWFALCLTSAVLGTSVGLAIVLLAGLPVSTTPAMAVLMAYIPYSAVGETAARRRRDIDRALPGTIDLIGLCVSAGLTFPQAVRDVVERAADPRQPMIEELRQMLRQLELGHGRAHALETFAERVPTNAVRDFVAAVVQSEAKGTPLKDVLATQATVLRARRSLLAEEAAAKASVKMTLPLGLMLLTNFVLIAGPLVLRTMEQGFFGG